MPGNEMFDNIAYEISIFFVHQISNNNSVRANNSCIPGGQLVSKKKLIRRIKPSSYVANQFALLSKLFLFQYEILLTDSFQTSETINNNDNDTNSS